MTDPTQDDGSVDEISDDVTHDDTDGEGYTPWTEDDESFVPSAIHRVMGPDGLPVPVIEERMDDALAGAYSPEDFVCSRDETEWVVRATVPLVVTVPVTQDRAVKNRQQRRATASTQSVTAEVGMIVGVYKGKREDLIVRGTHAGTSRPRYWAALECIEWQLPRWDDEEPIPNPSPLFGSPPTPPAPLVLVQPRRWECEHLVEKLYPLNANERLAGMKLGHTKRFCSIQTTVRGGWLSLTNESIKGCTARRPYDVASAELIHGGNRNLAERSGKNRQYFPMFKLAPAPVNPEDKEGLDAWLQERMHRESLGEELPPLPEGIELAKGSPDEGLQMLPGSEAHASVFEVAGRLAQEHMAEDPKMWRAYWFAHTQQLRLIEVSDAVPDTNPPEVLPFVFQPDPPDVPYPSVVVLMSPGDWERVQAGELPLPPKFLEGTPGLAQAQLIATRTVSADGEIGTWVHPVLANISDLAAAQKVFQEARAEAPILRKDARPNSIRRMSGTCRVSLVGWKTFSGGYLVDPREIAEEFVQDPEGRLGRVLKELGLEEEEAFVRLDAGDFSRILAGFELHAYRTLRFLAIPGEDLSDQDRVESVVSALVALEPAPPVSVPFLAASPGDEPVIPSASSSQGEYGDVDPVETHRLQEQAKAAYQEPSPPESPEAQASTEEPK